MANTSRRTADERDAIDDFLEAEALAGFEDEDDEDPAALLELLSRDPYRSAPGSVSRCGP